MNKKIISLLTALLFSTLFFKQHLGLNMVLFASTTVLVLAVLYPNKFKTLKTVGYAFFYLLSAAIVFFYNSDLALIASTLSFFVLLGAVIEPKTSIYVQVLNGFYTSIASFFAITFQQFQEEAAAVKKQAINYGYWAKMIGIPLIVVTVFIVLYRSANPIFDGIIQQLNFSFINIPWLLFTALGYFLMLNITHPVKVETITATDLATPNILTKKTGIKQPVEGLQQENQLATVLLVVLNGLLIFFLIADFVYLVNITDLTAPDLSKTVHEGIYALITSIVFAIAIILYFFRGNLNFFEKNRNVKLLTFTWILLNVVLVLVTSYKNYLYVFQYGFTYKRIGVFIYLGLSLIGLITTFTKVSEVYNLWYLLRKNTQVAYLLLIVLTMVNWDFAITRYNLEIAKSTDMNYLIELSNNNALLLKEYTEKHPERTLVTVQKRVEEKYWEYLRQLKKNSWQESVYDNIKLVP